MNKLENKGNSVAFYILSLVSFLITLSLNFAAVFGDAWWIWIPQDPMDQENHELGLLRYCVIKGKGKYCKFNKAIGWKRLWSAKKSGLEPQKISILFITSTVFCLLATIVTVPLIAYHRKRYFRSISGGLAATFAFVGAFAQFGGLIYGQYYDSDLNDYKLGWTAIVGWVGATSFLFSALISLTSIFIPRTEQDGGIAISDDPLYLKANNSSYNYENNAFVTNY